MLRAGSQSIRCSVVVHLGTGFHASVVRGVVTGLSMIVRHQFPHEVRASVSQGSTLLASHLTKPNERVPFAHHLETAAEQVRRA
jgi:hypothetical protein